MIARGAWHQFGHESAAIAADVFPQAGGGGVGAIFSPKDGALVSSTNRAASFRGHGKQVMWDPQFYRLSFQNRYTQSYPTDVFRVALARNGSLSSAEQSALSQALEAVNRDLGSVAVIAPAVVMEASTPGHLLINEMLYKVAKQAGDRLGIPTVAPIPIASSASASEVEVDRIIQRITAWGPDAWYLLYDFDGDALPSDLGRLQLWAKTSLNLAGTGKPLIQGYQGMLSAVAVGLGSHAIAVGHFQTLWHFDPDHWQVTSSPSRSGPPKFLSVPLWHNLKFPDDFTLLPTPQGDPHLTVSPWSAVPQSRRMAANWRHADARRHFMFVSTQWIDSAMALPSSRQRASFAKSHLDDAQRHWATLGRLSYPTMPNIPHRDWSGLLDWALINKAHDYDWLDLISV